MKKRIAIPLIIAAAASGFFAHETFPPKITFNDLLAEDEFSDFNDPFERENEYAANARKEYNELVVEYNELLQEHKELVQSKNKVIGIADELIEENKKLTRQRNYWHNIYTVSISTPVAEPAQQASTDEQQLMLLDEQNQLLFDQNIILDDIYHNSF